MTAIFIFSKLGRMLFFFYLSIGSFPLTADLSKRIYFCMFYWLLNLTFYIQYNINILLAHCNIVNEWFCVCVFFYLQLNLFLRYCYLCRILKGRPAIHEHWVHVILMQAANRRQPKFVIEFEVRVWGPKIDPYSSMPI